MFYYFPMKEKLNHYRLRNVTLRQLRVLSAIAQTGRIQSAAKALGVTAPAVTQQLALLEADTGMPLFERTRQGLRLTDAGTVMLGVSARIETLLNDAADTCAQFKGLNRGRVVVGATSTAKYLVPRVIAEFTRMHPMLQFELRVQNRQQITASLDEFDLAIIGIPPGGNDLEKAVIGPHPHVMIAAAGHRLAKLDRVSTDDLAGEVILMREAGSGTRALMDATFHELRFAPRSFKEFGSNETIKQAVIAGLGIAFISAHTVAAEVGAGWLELLPVDGVPVVREWYAIRAKGRQQRPASKAFWDFVVAKGADYLPDMTPRPVKSPRKRHQLAKQP